MQVMSEDFAGDIPGKTYYGRYSAQNDAVAKIKAAKAANPNEKVILVGHSWGGDSVIEVAQALAKQNICVDQLVQIDSVGVGDEKLPSNVTTGVNIWSTSRKGVNGASNVEGSTNVGIDNTTHTDIDEKDDAGTSSQEGYEGLNAYKIVQRVIKKELPAAGFGNLALSGVCGTGQCDTDVPEQDDFDLREGTLWDKLDEAGFCYEVDQAGSCIPDAGCAIEDYMDDAEALLAQIDAAWCDGTQLTDLLAQFSAFVDDPDGVLECEEGANARPFDDAIHSVIGACCLGDKGQCVTLTQEECDQATGVSHPGQSCAAVIAEGLCVGAIPTVSQWGLVAIGLLTLICGTIVLRKVQRRAA